MAVAAFVPNRCHGTKDDDTQCDCRFSQETLMKITPPKDGTGQCRACEHGINLHPSRGELAGTM
jgi:hypothetical protein